MPGRNVKVTEETTKHGTRSAEGKRRARDRDKARAVEEGLVDPEASVREVEQALATKREGQLSMRQTFAELEPDLVHVCDLYGGLGQTSVHPNVMMTIQLPKSYAGDLALLAAMTEGSVFLRAYIARPDPAPDDAA